MILFYERKYQKIMGEWELRMWPGHFIGGNDLRSINFAQRNETSHVFQSHKESLDSCQLVGFYFDKNLYLDNFVSPTGPKTQKTRNTS